MNYDGLWFSTDSSIAVSHGERCDFGRTRDESRPSVRSLSFAFDDGLDDGWMVGTHIDKTCRDTSLRQLWRSPMNAVVKVLTSHIASNNAKAVVYLRIVSILRRFDVVSEPYCEASPCVANMVGEAVEVVDEVCRTNDGADGEVR